MRNLYLLNNPRLVPENGLLCRLSLGLATLLAVLASCVGRAAETTPNIVIVLADDLGYGDVQALNPASHIPTPNLNRLAAEGLTFTDAHSPSAVCTPTRYGLLTGRYCWRSRLKKGVLGGYSQPLLDAERWTIGNLLQSEGYATAAVGKWHLGMQLAFRESSKTDAGLSDTTSWEGDPGVDFSGKIEDSPIDHGFDQYFGVTASLDMPPYVFVRDDRFTAEPTIQQPAVKFPHFVRAGPRAEDFVMDQVLDRLTTEAVAFIEQQDAQVNPYFLYVALTGPHKPTLPHSRFRGRTKLGEYGDFVHQVDWSIGQIMQAVEQTNASENTLVVVTSDNGSYMYRYDEADRNDHTDDPSIQGFRAENHRANGPLRGTKADIWEAGHRIPCFVRWPLKVKPGRQSAATVCLTDLFATCAEVASLELPDSQAEDSFSWLSILEAEGNESASQQPANTRGAPVIHHSVSGMFAIRDGKWKLVCGNGSGGREKPRGRPFEKPYQLFDLENDMAESTDVADQNPEIVSRMSTQLDEIRKRGRSRPLPGR